VRYASIARVYAAALLELAADKGELEAVSTDLLALRELWTESPDFRRLLESPELGSAQKRRALEKALADAASPITLRFLLVLLRRHREPLLGTILDMYRRLMDDREGRLRGRLTSASTLAAEELEQIEAALSRSTGAKVLLDAEIDEELLAGMVLSLADQTVDGSLKTRLGRLRDRLMTAELGKE
jgi:F-type H+-transporting ATPase subunit delta